VSTNREDPRDQRTSEHAEPRDTARLAHERDQAVRELLELEHAATEGPEVPRRP
jgi:hypothetical protein